jgi:hypothetical protein
MATLITIVTTQGRVIEGIDYRTDPSKPSSPNVPLTELTGGFYHIQTRYGWTDIPASQVRSITTRAGAPT